MRHFLILFISTLLVLTPGLASSNPLSSSRNTVIYHAGWIDLNKNGRMDVYEDPKANIDARIDDLLSQMNLDEKTCQLATLYGYDRVLKDTVPTPEWKTRIWKDGIANIDEHANGKGKDGSKSPYVSDLKQHIGAMNAVQRFFIEETRLGIPADFTNEGTRGVAAYGTTTFPTQLGIGHTWDRSLVRDIGGVTAREARALGYTNVYAPILDVARDQRWGRILDVYGEEPYLTSRLGVEMVKGMQENYTVASTAKHFAVYSNSKGAREGQARTDPQTTPREVEDIFLPPFKAAIKEGGLLGIMSSYNDYDGQPVTGSKYWLTDRLRTDFGFHGYVVSDSGAVEYLYRKHAVAADAVDAVRLAAEAGLNVRTDFTNPSDYILPLRQLVKEGRLSIKTVDDRVRDVLRVKFLVGIFDRPYVEDVAASEKLLSSPASHELSARASRESLVLLKNDHNVLPLSKAVRSVAVIGPNADDQWFANSRYGPTNVNVVTVLQGIKNKLGSTAKVTFAKGCNAVSEHWPESEVLPEPLTAVEQNEISEAVAAAGNSDVAIVILGDSGKTIGESQSRTSLDLPGHQLDLVQAVYATGKPVIVVLINGRPMSINWIDKYVPGILEAWLPGADGGDAIADALFGDYNPGGKLTVTFPKTVGQIPYNFPTKPNSQWEGEKTRVNGALYYFGFGLSYTKFEYSNLKIDPLRQNPGGGVTVTADIKNIGGMAGDEVVQLYTRDVLSSVTTYEKNLRGFERVHLSPGETRTVTFHLVADDFGLWNPQMQFVVEPGKFNIMVGASSEDIRLKGDLEYLGTRPITSRVLSVHER
jgi:beta-glucosidase